MGTEIEEKIRQVESEPEKKEENPPKISDEIASNAVQQLIKGSPKNLVIEELLAKGVKQEDADEFMATILPALKRHYLGRMISGAMWTAGGLGVTIYSYLTAAKAPSGGTYILAWGAVIFGIYNFARGFLGWKRFK